MRGIFIHRCVKGSFWKDQRCVLFVHIVILLVVLEGPAFGAVCVHRNVKDSFLRDLCWLLIVYIVILMVAFGETRVRCCL